MKKKNHKGKDILFLIIGLLSSIYYFINIPISGVFTFHALFLLGGCFLICYGTIELYLKQNLLAFLSPLLRTCILSIIGIGLICFTIIEGMIVYYGTQETYQQSDAVIVLGAGLMQDQISATLRYRLDRTLSYHKKYPDVPIIVTGGQGKDESRSEAEAMKEYLIANGVDETLIYMEDKATNTYENFLYSDALLKQQNIPVETVTVITNRFHMFRSIYIGKQFHYEITALAADDYLPLAPQTYVREFFAVIKAFLLYR